MSCVMAPDTKNMRGIHRGNLRLIVIISGILLMSFNATYFKMGIFIFSAGALLHFLSKGYLYRKVELAVRGPYSFNRHPFYMANLLLDTGILFMCGRPLVIPIYLCLFFKSYHKVIIEEEKELTATHGDLYRHYIKTVPRYFLTPIPFVRDWHAGFNWKNILRERELSRTLRLITYPVSFLIINEIVKYKWNQPRIVLVLAGSTLITILLWASYFVHIMVERDRISGSFFARAVKGIFSTTKRGYI